MQDKARKELKVDDPSSIKVGKIDPDYTPQQAAAVKEGMGGYNQMVSKRVTGQSTSVDINNTSERGYYEQFGGRGMALSQNYRTSTVTIHEMGHHLEHHNSDVHYQAQRFLRYRTQGEDAISLATHTGHVSYDKSEVAKPDRFINPYMGKIYRDNEGKNYATEIISMGLEKMWADPVGFAKADPQYFDFMYSVVRGVW